MSSARRGAQAVGDHDPCTAAQQSVYGALDLRLRRRIQTRRRLVEDDQTRVM